MVDGWNVSANKPGYTWHMAYLRDEGRRMKKRGGVDRLGVKRAVSKNSKRIKCK
jgi:hypothetical protein